jgi:hypothetical protein
LIDRAALELAEKLSPEQMFEKLMQVMVNVVLLYPGCDVDFIKILRSLRVTRAKGRVACSGISYSVSNRLRQRASSLDPIDCCVLGVRTLSVNIHGPKVLDRVMYQA